jgi:FixJ family two-component response regulator
MNVCLFDAEPEAKTLWSQLAVDQGLRLSIFDAWHPTVAPADRTHILIIDQSAVRGDFAEGVLSIRTRHSSLALAVSTGSQLTVKQAVAVMRHGVYHVLAKPYNIEQVNELLGELRLITAEIEASREEHARLTSLFQTLTHRERHVLDCVLAGDSNKEAARKLNVSVRTVESRRAKVYRKLELKHVSELVRKIDRLEQLNSIFDSESLEASRSIPHPYLQRFGRRNRLSDVQAC